MKQVKYNTKISPLERAIEIFSDNLYSLTLSTQLIFLPTQKTLNFYFDLFSYPYDLGIQIIWPSYRGAIELLLKEDIPVDSKVLDLCCGTGNLTLAAAKKAKEVIGLDSSQGMLKRAKKKAKRRKIHNVSFVYGNVKERLDFPDEQLDVVTASLSVPNHTPLFRDKNEDIMKEAYRVLKSGGSLVLLGPFHDKPYKLGYQDFSLDEYENLLSKTGYENIEMKIINNFFVIVSAEKN